MTSLCVQLACAHLILASYLLHRPESCTTYVARSLATLLFTFPIALALTLPRTDLQRFRAPLAAAVAATLCDGTKVGM